MDTPPEKRRAEYIVKHFISVCSCIAYFTILHKFRNEVTSDLCLFGSSKENATGMARKNIPDCRKNGNLKLITAKNPPSAIAEPSEKLSIMILFPVIFLNWFSLPIVKSVSYSIAESAPEVNARANARKTSATTNPANPVLKE